MRVCVCVCVCVCDLRLHGSRRVFQVRVEWVQDDRHGITSQKTYILGKFPFLPSLPIYSLAFILLG